MKTKHYFIGLLMLVLLVLASCEKDKSLLQPGMSDAAVSLSVGNVFQYQYSAHSGGILTDIFSKDNVTNITGIDHETWAVVNDGERLVRADASRFYERQNGSEFVKLDFDVNDGDIVSFMDYSVKVESIKNSDVFDETRQVIFVSGSTANGDTTISGQYTRTFGVLTFFKYFNNRRSGYSLSGALIDGIEYGLIHL